MWKAHHYASGNPMDSGGARVPTLKLKQQDSTIRVAETNKEKGKMLQEAFFSQTGRQDGGEGGTRLPSAEI